LGVGFEVWISDIQWLIEQVAARGCLAWWHAMAGGEERELRDVADTLSSKVISAARVGLPVGVFALVVMWTMTLRAETPPVTELQGVVSEWIQLRSTISREQQAWEGEQERLEAYIDVLERRRDVMVAEVEANREVRTSASTQVGELARRQGELEAVLSEFDPTLTQVEQTAATWLAKLPAPLQGEARTTMGAGSIGGASSTTVAARLQRYLSFCAALETLRSRIEVKRQEVETDGVSHEYEMLYLGAAQAYGITPNRAKAVWGYPVDGRWQWTRIDAQAPDVAAAIDMLANDAPARYVTLPVMLAGPTADVKPGVSP
jgi:hypothetical protein